MKLRNKKTGERGIINYFDNQCIVIYPIDENWNAKGDKKYVYNSLAELNEDWEDYEEPKGSALDLMILTLINFIENEPDEDKVDLEDCKQMLEKLKAWKRLKDKGFRFKKWDYSNGMHIDFEFIKQAWATETEPDLNLLFGGKK